MPGAKWFPGARTSYAEHIFRGKDDDQVAIRHASELRELGEWTWAELRAQTAAIAGGLRALGVGQGDRVVAYMPNIPETVAAFLACASIGAVWSSAAPEFGARSVIDRFAQIEPKVLLAIDGYRYGGKDYDRAQTVEAIAAEIPSLEKVVRFGYLDGSGWEDGFLGAATELEFTPLPFDHPLWVLYSSGTTGLPKPIVHGQGGILLEQTKKMHLHLDAQAEDRVFWFSTTGWMMWNFLVGVLLTEASIVLYDGNPGYPSLGRPVGSGRDGRHHDLRDQRGLHRLVHEGGGGAARGTGAERAEGGGIDRFAAVAGGLSVGLRPARRATRGCSRPRAGPTCARRSWAACRCRPVYLGELQCRCLGCAVRGLGPRRPAAGRRGRRAGHHQADALDADLLLG